MSVHIAYHPKQEEFLFDPAKKKLVRKGRRFGGTKGLANYISESILEGRHNKVLWGDVSLGNAKKYWRRYFYPIWKSVDTSLWDYGKQENEFRFSDGKRDAYIDFRGADHPDGWEGFGYDLIVLNEAGIILADDYLWYNAVLPMSLEYDADIIVLGTPKGKKGIYYDLNLKAERGEDGWKLFSYSSYDNPLIPRAKVEELERSLPSIVAKQEIYAEFIDEAGAVFKYIDELATQSEQDPIEGEQYFMGLDLAKTGDYTTMKVMNPAGVEVYSERFNSIEWKQQKLRVAAVAEKYNHASVLVDKTGVGDPVLEDLVDMGVNAEGFHFTNESKFNLVKHLVLGFENKKIRILNDNVTKNELKNFEYTITATKKIKFEGRTGHDDTVMALALAYFQIKDNAIPTIRQIPASSAAKVGNVEVKGGRWTTNKWNTYREFQ